MDVVGYLVAGLATFAWDLVVDLVEECDYMTTYQGHRFIKKLNGYTISTGMPSYQFGSPSPPIRSRR
jgi:hypothetical protein